MRDQCQVWRNCTLSSRRSRDDVSQAHARIALLRRRCRQAHEQIVFLRRRLRGLPECLAAAARHRNARTQTNKTRRDGGSGGQELLTGGVVVGGVGGLDSLSAGAAAGFLRGRPRWPGATRRLAV